MYPRHLFPEPELLEDHKLEDKHFCARTGTAVGENACHHKRWSHPLLALGWASEHIRAPETACEHSCLLSGEKAGLGCGSSMFQGDTIATLSISRTNFIDRGTKPRSLSHFMVTLQMGLCGQEVHKLLSSPERSGQAGTELVPGKPFLLLLGKQGRDNTH